MDFGGANKSIQQLWLASDSTKNPIKNRKKNAETKFQQTFQTV